MGLKICSAKSIKAQHLFVSLQTYSLENNKDRRMAKSASKKKSATSSGKGNGSNKSKTKAFIAFLKSERFKRVRGVFYILFSLFLLVSLVSYFFNWKSDEALVLDGGSGTRVVQNIGGMVGAWLGNLFVRNGFGFASLGFVLLFFVYGFRLLGKNILPYWKTIFITSFWIIWISLFLGTITQWFDVGVTFEMCAGTFGIYIAKLCCGIIGKFGTTLVVLFSMLFYLIIVHNIHLKIPALNVANLTQKFNEKKAELKEKFHREKDDEPEHEVVQPVVKMEKPEVVKPVEEVKPASKVDEYFESDFEIQDNYSKILADPQEEEVGFEVNSIINVAGSASQQVDDLDEEDAETDQSSDDDMKHYGLDEPYDPKLDLSDYQLPSVDMLVNYEAKNVEVTKEELVANKNKIVETLKNYSIDIVKIVASPGPTVTLYEIVPAPGIRISKIKNLEDDIALSLAALGIRIIAPIPGKGTIGIEVPNANPQIVSMRTMLTSDKFLNNKFELPIAIGKTISNEPYVADLCKMPHLLMAGATGQGKSVGLNAIIASLLYKKHPAELKFIMVDPKKVELSLYNKIERHYLAKLPDSEEAIITDTRKVVRTLNSLCIEMDARYDLLKQAQVKNIKEYNPKFMSRRLNPEKGHRYLPYIVVVVDEFADLIMTAGKEVEHPIARIAQLARAVGIHLIIATQRPSVNIITGTIKANFPARIAFRVTSKIDSRTILDTGGADQLIGRGDMLLSSGSEIVRLQCALIDTEEIEKVAEFIGSQRGYPDCFLLPEYLDEESEPNKEFDPKQKDEYFEEAARLVVTSQHGSTSLLQRKLQLGYNRAGRIIDQLEAAGIVGPFEGSKAREVLIKTEAELKEHLKNMTH